MANIKGIPSVANRFSSIIIGSVNCFPSLVMYVYFSKSIMFDIIYRIQFGAIVITNSSNIRITKLVFICDSFFVGMLFYFWKINKCSCIIRRKFDSFDFFTRNHVALQLCCTLTISSFNSNQTSKNFCITLNAIGWYIFFLLVSPIRIAQNFHGLRTL